LEFLETAVDDEVLSCFALPPLATFVGLWLEREVALADCLVGATWIVDWDCRAPPVCVWVARWTVVLSFWAVAEDVEELVWTLCTGSFQSSAEAVRGTKPATAKRAAQASRVHKHLDRLPMAPASPWRKPASRPRVAGFSPPGAVSATKTPTERLECPTRLAGGGWIAAS
jgi:hypothetical protein